MRIKTCISKEYTRQTCIKHSYYTRGCNEEYSAMLDMCSGEVDAEALMRIAEDIARHSVEDDAKIIASNLLNDACATFIEYDEVHS